MIAAEANCRGAGGVREGSVRPLCPALGRPRCSAASAWGPARGNGAVGAGPERGRHDDERLQRLCHGDGLMGARGVQPGGGSEETLLCSVRVREGGL